jgi:hypothetical protein
MLLRGSPGFWFRLRLVLLDVLTGLDGLGLFAPNRLLGQVHPLLLALRLVLRRVHFLSER